MKNMVMDKKRMEPDNPIPVTITSHLYGSTVQDAAEGSIAIKSNDKLCSFLIRLKSGETVLAKIFSDLEGSFNIGVLYKSGETFKNNSSIILMSCLEMSTARSFLEV